MKRQAINKKLLIATLCTSAIAGTLISSSSYADSYIDNWMINTGFKDPALFECVLYEYEDANGVSVDDIYNEIGPYGALPEEGLNNIEMLYCSNYYVSDTTGLEKLPNIEYLNLSRNQIRKIDLSKNTKLKEVVLDRNYLTSIDLSKNRDIKALKLANNSLLKANLYYNTNLIALDISNNNLTELDLSNSPLLSAFNADSIDLTTSARAKKSNGVYTLRFPMPFYINSSSPYGNGTILNDAMAATTAAAPVATFSSEPAMEEAPIFDRWSPADSPDYSYDIDSSNYLVQKRESLPNGLGLEHYSSISGGGNTYAMLLQLGSEATGQVSSVAINPRPVSIVPSIVVDGTSYELSDTSKLPAKYIGESWDSNDYRGVVDQALAANGKENVKLTKVEIYNSLKDAPNVEVGLDSKSTSMHLFGTIPDIEVPMMNIAEKEMYPDDEDEEYEEYGEVEEQALTRAPSSPMDRYSYNPEIILAQGTPDFRIVYHFETVEPEIYVPDTGFNARWEGSETTSATPVAMIVAFASLALGFISHLIKCASHKVSFKKH